jgi:DNA-binding MarR family transcriptional regulator
MLPVGDDADIFPDTDGAEGGRGSPEDPRWLSATEQDAWRAYIRLAKMLTRQLDRDLNPFGLSTNDYEILAELSEAPGHRLRMSELAELTAQSRSRLSHQITRMEARGLIRRDACTDDKRGTFAVITSHGVAAMERVAPSHVESVRTHFMDHLSPAELQVLTAAYRPVLEHLRGIRDLD